MFLKRESLTFENVSFVCFKELFQKHGGKSVPAVTAVINLFGQDRIKQGRGTDMLHHVLDFKDKLPSCMLPEPCGCEAGEATGKFIDLIQRSAFFASIEELEIRTALLKIPESTANYEEFTKVAIETEQLLKGNKSSSDALQKVDGIQQNDTTTVLKVESNSGSKSRGRKNWRGRGGKPSHRGEGTGSGNQPNLKNDSSANKEVFCWSCGGKGHKSPVCPNKGASVGTKSVDMVQPNGSQIYSHSIFSVNVSCNDIRRGDHIDMSLILNGNVQAMFEFDTAAGACIMPKAWLALFSPEHRPVLQTCNIKLDLANGQTADVAGLVHIDVVTSACKRMKPVKAIFYVVDGPHALLGKPLIRVLFSGLYNNMMTISDGLYHYHGDKNYVQVPPRMLVAKNVAISGNPGASSQSTGNDSSSKGSDASAVSQKTSDKGATKVETAPLCTRLPKAPTGNVPQKEGADYCKLIASAHPKLFDGERGTAVGPKVKLYLKPNAEKEFRVVPHAKIPVGIREAVRKQIAKMNETSTRVSGIGLKVSSQVVPVVKKKGDEIKVRTCINYKTTINPLLEDFHYPFPTINEECEKLSGGEFYSTVDIKDAFPHFLLDDESKPICTYSTEDGFRQPDRLPQGIKTAPAIFQSYASKTLAGIPSCAVVVDDICVTGANASEHFKNLESVSHKLEEAGMKLNPEKCKFYLPEVKYVGRIINKDGQKMDPSAVEAILQMPSPSSRQELQSFLGYLSYVRRHVPALSHITPTLSALLKKNVKFVWTNEHEKAFQKCKELAGNLATLAHFDEKLELVLTTDASPVGIGACLSHKVTEGNKSYLKPIAYASRSLTPAERNYAQIDREGLAVHWAINYFRQFLLCRHFILQTDCSALTKIFGSKNDMGGIARGRMNRWCVELMEYDFTAQHIKGDKNLVCDGLSRLPHPSPDSLLIEDSGSGVPGCTTAEFVKISVKCLSALPMGGKEVIACCKSEEVASLALQGLPLTAADIAKATREDPLYGRVLTAVKTGVFDHQDKTLSPFTSVKDSLTLDAGCLLYGSRVVIPPRQQTRLLFELHTTHMGVVKMKSLAREYIWWPGLNKDIESLAAKCEGCARFKKKPAPVPLTHWPWATRPMERIHVDFAEYRGVQLLIVIDAYSKYIWTFIMGKDTTTPRLLRQMDSIFAERGLPTTVVSDNGPQFTSKAFSEHMKAKSIKHVLTPPYHPASNGLAEAAVGIVKNHLYKMDASAHIPLLQDAVTTVMFIYRQTPTTSTGRTPFEMMDYNKVVTPMSLLHPSGQRRNESLQQQKVYNRDSVSATSLRVFTEGENVLVYNTLTKKNDIGTVQNVVGRNCYNVDIDGRVRLVSADVMSKCNVITENNEDSEPDVDAGSDSDSDSECEMDIRDYSSNGSNPEGEYASSIVDDNVRQRQNNLYVIPQKRHYRTEVEKLHDSLSKGPVVSRTRSGRVQQ